MLLAAGLFAATQVFRHGPRVRRESARESSALPAPVGPGVYLVDLSPSAAYVVDTSDGLVLVDTGIDAGAAPLIERASEWGLDLSRLRAILLTHVHGDHSLGAEYLRELTGARVYAGRGDCPALRAGGPREAFFGKMPMPGRATHPTHVDVELSGGEAFAFGDVQFRAIATPGHTPGSICYLMERDGHRVLFTGDVVQTVTGKLGTYTAYLAPLYGGDARAYLASLRALRELPVPEYVLVGHPQAERVPGRRRLSAEQWRSVLDRGIAEMQQLVARYDVDGANFLDGAPRRLLPDLYYLGNHRGGAVYALTTAHPSRLFLFGAPGGPGLVDLLHVRAKDLGLKWQAPTAVLLTSADGGVAGAVGELVEKTGCTVVAPRDGLMAVQSLCPAGTKLVSADGLTKAGWFDVTAMPLAGPIPTVAYVLHCSGKTVLVTDRFPVARVPEGPGRLRELVAASGGDASHYRESLGKLRKLQPDLWLPAQPMDDPNANLYGPEWEETLSLNEAALR